MSILKYNVIPIVRGKNSRYDKWKRIRQRGNAVDEEVTERKVNQNSNSMGGDSRSDTMNILL